MNTLLSVSQIVVAIAIIALILLQQRDSDSMGFLGGGGGGGGGFYQQRRGLERAFFNITIVLVVIFACLALFNLFSTPPIVNVDTLPVASSTDAASGSQADIVPASSSAPLPLDF